MRKLHLLAAWCLVSIACAQEKSGPPVGQPLPPLKVFDATGPNAGKELDYGKEYKNAPTFIIIFNRFDRPPARFMKKFDDWAKTDEGKGLKTLAVFLTDDIDMWKDRLPKVQMSLKLESFPLVICLGPKEGPQEYQLSDRVDVTVILAKDGKVVEAKGIVSCNDTDVPEFVRAAKKLLGK